MAMVILCAFCCDSPGTPYTKGGRLHAFLYIRSHIHSHSHNNNNNVRWCECCVHTHGIYVMCITVENSSCGCELQFLCGWLLYAGYAALLQHTMGMYFFFSACVSYIRTLGMFTSVWSSHARTHALSINICNTHTHAARTQNSQVEMTCEWCMCVRVPFLTMWCDIIINITMSLCVLYHDDEVRVIEAWKWYSAHCHRRHPHMTKCPPSLVVLVMTISSKA